MERAINNTILQTENRAIQAQNNAEANLRAENTGIQKKLDTSGSGLLRAGTLGAVDTMAEATHNIIKGAFKSLEGVVDFAANITGVFGNDDFKNKVQDFVSKNWVGDWYAENIENSDIYKRLTDDSYLKYGSETVQRIGYGVEEGVGQMLPTIALGALGVGQVGTLAQLGASASGNATESAYQEGANYGEGTAYGILSGALEVATEMMFGGIEGMNVKGIFDKPVENAINKVTDVLGHEVMTKFLFEIGEEGIEEMVSEFVEPFIKRVTYDQNADLATLSEVLEAGLIGGLTAGIMNGATNGLQRSTAKGRVQANLQNAQTVMETIERATNENKPEVAERARQDYNYYMNKAQSEMDSISDDYKAKYLVDNAKSKSKSKQASAQYLRQYFDENGKLVEGAIKTEADIARLAENKRLGITSNQNSVDLDKVVEQHNERVALEEQKITKEDIAKKSDLTEGQSKLIEFLNKYFPNAKFMFINKEAMTYTEEGKGYKSNARYNDLSNTVFMSTDIQNFKDLLRTSDHETTHKGLIGNILTSGIDSKQLNAIMNALATKGANEYEALYKSLDDAGYIDGAKENGEFIVKKGKEDVFEKELPAHFIEAVFNGEDNYSMLYKIARDHANVLEKIRLKAFAKANSLNTNESEFVKEYKDELNDIVKIIDEAVKYKDLGYNEFASAMGVSPDKEENSESRIEDGSPLKIDILDINEYNIYKELSKDNRVDLYGINFNYAKIDENPNSIGYALSRLIEFRQENIDELLEKFAEIRGYNEKERQEIAREYIETIARCYKEGKTNFTKEELITFNDFATRGTIEIGSRERYSGRVVELGNYDNGSKIQLIDNSLLPKKYFEVINSIKNNKLIKISNHTDEKGRFFDEKIGIAFPPYDKNGYITSDKADVQEFGEYNRRKGYLYVQFLESYSEVLDVAEHEFAHFVYESEDLIQEFALKKVNEIVSKYKLQKKLTNFYKERGYNRGFLQIEQEIFADFVSGRILKIYPLLNENSKFVKEIHELKNSVKAKTSNKGITLMESRTVIKEPSEKQTYKYVAKATGDKYVNYKTTEELVNGISEQLSNGKKLSAKIKQNFAEELYKIYNLNAKDIQKAIDGKNKKVIGYVADSIENFNRERIAEEIAKHEFPRDKDGNIIIDVVYLKNAVNSRLVELGDYQTVTRVENGVKNTYFEPTKEYNERLQQQARELLTSLDEKGHLTKAVRDLLETKNHYKERISQIYADKQTQKQAVIMKRETARLGATLRDSSKINKNIATNEIYEKSKNAGVFDNIKSGKITRDNLGGIVEFATEFVSEKNPIMQPYFATEVVKNEVTGQDETRYVQSKYTDLINAVKFLKEYYENVKRDKNGRITGKMSMEFVENMRDLVAGLDTLIQEADDIYINGVKYSRFELATKAVEDYKRDRIITGENRGFWNGIVTKIKQFFQLAVTPKTSLILFARGNANNPVVKLLEQTTYAKYRANALFLKATEPIKDMLFGDKEYRNHYNNDRIEFEFDEQEIEMRETNISKGKNFGKQLSRPTEVRDANGNLVTKATGNKIKVSLTVGEALSLIGMCSQEGVSEGLLKNGFEYTDENNVKHVYKGIPMDAVKAFEEKVFKNEKDKKFYELQKQAYDMVSQRAMEQDYNLTGKTNKVKNGYFPTIRNTEMLNENFASWQNIQQNIYNIGWAKSRVKNSRGLVLSDSVETLFRVTEIMSTYAEMGAELDTIGKVLGTKFETETGTGRSIVEMWDEDYTTGKKKSNYAEDYINDLMTDFVHQRKNKSRGSDVMDWIRRNYIRAAYGLNLSIIGSQLASFPNQFAYIDGDLGIKAMNMVGKEKATFNEMMKYSALAQVRYNKYSNYVLSAESNAVDEFNRAMDVTMKGMTETDKLVINYIWNASKLQIARNLGVAEVNMNDAEVIRQVVELFEKTVIDTQIGSTVGEKSAMQRSTSEFVKTFTIGKGVSTKNLSMLVSSLAQAKYSHDLLKAYEKGKIKLTEQELADAKKNAKMLDKLAVKSFSAVIVANMFFVMLKQLVSHLFNKDDKDKDGNEISAWEAMGSNYLSAMLGMIPFASDVYNYFAKGYDIEGYSYSMINDSLGALKNLGNIGEGGAKTANAIRSALYAGSSLFGIPLKNFTTQSVGIVSRFNEQVKYDWNDLFKTNKTYLSDLQKANESGDTKLADHILELYINSKGVEASNSTTSTLADLYNKGYTNVLPKAFNGTITYNGEEYALSKKEQKQFTAVYSQAEKSIQNLNRQDLFKSASDEVKSKAIKMIYDYYYTLAVRDYMDDGESSKIEMFADIIGIEKLAMIVSECKAIKGENKKLQVMQVINKQHLTNAQKYMILGYLGYKNDAGYSSVSSEIKKLKLSKEQEATLLEYSGYNVA